MFDLLQATLEDSYNTAVLVTLNDEDLHSVSKLLEKSEICSDNAESGRVCSYWKGF